MQGKSTGSLGGDQVTGAKGFGIAEARVSRSPQQRKSNMGAKGALASTRSIGRANNKMENSQSEKAIVV